VAAVLQEATQRATDVAARYGGDEFALVLPSTDEEGAAIVVRRALTRVEHMSIHHADSSSGFVTVSLGAATAHPHVDQRVEELVAAADRALYRAKVVGGNRAEFEVLAAETPDSE
jgi:diguanylate cyclase (GGDEF)-like protein